MQIMEKKLSMGVITANAYAEIVKAHAEDGARNGDAEAPDRWHLSTASSGINNTTLDYLAAVSVVPLQKIELYNELYELSGDGMGATMTPSDFARNMAWLNDEPLEEGEICLVMSIFDRGDETGYRLLPRDYRMYPVAAFLEKVYAQRGKLKPALARFERNR